jgi:hypothetical protein
VGEAVTSLRKTGRRTRALLRSLSSAGAFPRPRFCSGHHGPASVQRYGGVNNPASVFDGQRSVVFRPVFLAIRASIRGPISSFVKREHDIRPAGAAQGLVRAGRTFDLPANTKKRRKNPAGLRQLDKLAVSGQFETSANTA